MASEYPDCQFELSDDFTELSVYCTADFYESTARANIAFGYVIYLDAYAGISGEEYDNVDFTLSFLNEEDHSLYQTFTKADLFS